MDEEIDLRVYIRVLIRRWYWIVGLAVLAASAAFAVSSFMPPTYEATAMAVITGPRYRMSFDSRMQDVPFDPKQYLKGYTEIATSDEILASLADAAHANGSTAAGTVRPTDLRSVLEAKATGDGNLIQLTARGADPQAVAELANRWAELYVSRLTDLYGTNLDLSFLEAQAARARSVVEQTDLALAAMRRDYGMGYQSATAPNFNQPLGIAYQLQAKTRLLGDYENRAEQIIQLLQEARTVATHADGSSPALISGLLVDMLGLGLPNLGASPLVQIFPADMDPKASVAALIDALDAMQSSTDQTIAQLKTEVASLQTEVARRQMELDQLMREQTSNQSTYLTLSNKLQESRVEANGDIARVASRAVAPVAPIGPRRVFNAALAGVVAVVVSVFAVVFIEYWRQPPAVPPAAETPGGGGPAAS